MRMANMLQRAMHHCNGRLASCPLVLFSYYTLPIAYEYLLNSNKDLDVVELWSGVESVVFADRDACVASHQGHQHIQAEGFDKTGLLALLITQNKDISLVERVSPCAPTDLSVGSMGPLVDGSHLFIIQPCELQPVQVQSGSGAVRHQLE